MIHPCFLCQGACCESIVFDEKQLSPDHKTWLLLHGKQKEGMIELDCKCKKLGKDGKCTIYENRPDMCRVFSLGGQACLNTIKRRRKNYKEIEKAIINFGINRPQK